MWLRSWPKRFRVIFCFKIVKKSPFLQHFFSLRTKLCCFLHSITLFFDLHFIALIFNSERFIIAEGSVLSTWGLWLPRRIFLFFGACFSQTSTKLFSKVQYSYELRELVSLINSDWKSVYVNFENNVKWVFLVPLSGMLS